MRNVILIALLVIIAGYFYFKSTDRSQEIISTQTSQEQATMDAADTQAQSEDAILVENLIKEGIISKIDTDGNTPKVYVTSDYYRAPDVDKNAILKVLFKDLQANNPGVNSFDLYDAKSGEKVDTYNPYAIQTR